jgi:hypothetical protein
MQRFGYQARSPQTAVDWLNHLRQHSQNLLTR